MTNITTKVLSECIDIATEETHLKLLSRNVDNGFNFHVTIDNLPRVFCLNGKESKKHIHKEYKAYALKNTLPNYVLLHDDPHNKKSRKNTAFAPAEHVLAFLRNRRSLSANALVKRIDDEIAKRTLTAETTRANKAEHTAKEAKAAQLRAEKEKEDETDRADAEYEMRIQEKKAADKKLHIEQKKRQAAENALMQISKEDQRELGWTADEYQTKQRHANENIQEHVKREIVLNQKIKNIEMQFEALGIVKNAGFRTVIDQALSIMHTDVINKQDALMGNSQMLALYGPNYSTTAGPKTRLKRASTVKINKIIFYFYEFYGKIEEVADSLKHEDYTRKRAAKKIHAFIRKLDESLFKLITPIGDKDGLHSHNSGAYGAKQHQKDIVEVNELEPHPRIVATFVIDAHEEVELQMTFVNNPFGSSDELDKAKKEICTTFINDATLVQAKNESPDERKVRQERLMACFKKHLPVKYHIHSHIPKVGHIDSTMREWVYDWCSKKKKVINNINKNFNEYSEKGGIDKINKILNNK